MPTQTPILTTITDLQIALSQVRSRGVSIGFVPTMGALHEGHAALIRAARKATGFVVVSIFVNPTQFGPNEDFSRYPRTLDNDRIICKESGADLIFSPSPVEMYPNSFETFVDVSTLDSVLCGQSRPGHFRGVCTVVLKLFNIVRPDLAVFGQKDVQQARIIRQMVRDLNVPVTLQIEPTVRESDGLALSSRNRYLSSEERAVAPRLYQALLAIRDQVAAGERRVELLETALREDLASIPGVRIDYARIVDEDTLQSIPTIERTTVVAVAVYLGNTRLIDNIIL